MLSCTPQKKIILMQYENLNDSSYANAFVLEDSILLEYMIQPNDYLYILVTAVEKDLTQFMEPLGGINFLNATNQSLIGYYVDDNGYVDYPYLGKIHVGGYTVQEAHLQVRNEASKILGDKMRVEVRLINNYINVLGEVKKEGLYNMTKKRITIYEAITLAGGLSDYAKRTEIKVFREVKGVRKVYVVDITSGNLIGNQMFYVFPNDVIYIEPTRGKAFGLSPTFSMQLFSSLVSVSLSILFIIQGVALLGK